MSKTEEKPKQTFVVRSASTSRRFYGSSFRRGVRITGGKSYRMHREGHEEYIPPQQREDGAACTAVSVGKPPFEHPDEISRSRLILEDEESGSKYAGSREGGILAKNYVFLVKSRENSSEFIAYRLSDWFKFRKIAGQGNLGQTIEEVEDLMAEARNIGEEYIEKKKQMQLDKLKKSDAAEDAGAKSEEKSASSDLEDVNQAFEESDSDDIEEGAVLEDAEVSDESSENQDADVTNGADFVEKFEDDEGLFTSGESEGEVDEVDERELFGSDSSDGEGEQDAEKSRTMQKLQEKVEELVHKEEAKGDSDSEFSEGDLEELEKDITIIPRNNPYNFVSKSRRGSHTPISSRLVSPILSGSNTPYDSPSEDNPSADGISGRRAARKRKRKMLTMKPTGKKKPRGRVEGADIVKTQGEICEFISSHERPTMRELVKRYGMVLKRLAYSKQFKEWLGSVATTDSNGVLSLK